MPGNPHLELTCWRRAVAELYARVRVEADPRRAHTLWRAGRDKLFTGHPQSPLPAGDPLRTAGLRYFGYDAALRFRAPLIAEADGPVRQVPSANDGIIAMSRIGRVQVLTSSLDVWWLRQYGGGIFLPVRDGTAGTDSYGGGRYLLDTAKGADLGGDDTELVLDFNFLYHPSCRYDPAWECPLAPEGNRLDLRIEAGERL